MIPGNMGSGGESSLSRSSSHKAYDAQTPERGAPPMVPVTFRMATASMLGKDDTEKEHILNDHSEPCTDSTYGVRSMQDSIHAADPQASDTQGGDHVVDDEEEPYIEGRRRSTLKPFNPTSSEDLKHTAEAQTPPYQHPSPLQSISHSVTSLSLDSQAPLSSMPSSPKSISNRSLRPSDEDSVDDGGSQAIVSSSDEEAPRATRTQDQPPQLIMPSIKMPSRRPFTQRGRDMGRLKILLAGDSGVGKTSLVKSIVQTCEDIVHADPLSSDTSVVERHLLGKSKRQTEELFTRATQQITEIHTSTRPYPCWWSDPEETKVLRRRKSMGDTVLERNLIFVDTPGYSNGLSKTETIEAVSQYIESQLRRSFAPPSESESDILGLLSGSGGSQVDLVLYLITETIKQEDIIFLQRLAAMTNVIPLIAKSDTLSPEELEMQRRSMTEQLRNADVQIFVPIKEDIRPPPYSVCSTVSSDDDNMDASLLMSSDYIQPLLPSQLNLVLDQIFEKETVSYLRYSASKKLLRAHGNASYAVTAASSAYTKGVSPYLQARLKDHIQQEERFAQIKLAKWASDLQRQFQTERAQYEGVMYTERAGWLASKLEECQDVDGGPAPATNSSTITVRNEKKLHGNRTRSHMGSRPGFTDADDPLGLLRWNEAMRKTSWLTIQIVGGFSLLGAMAMWTARTWGAGGEDGWVWEWLGFR